MPPKKPPQVPSGRSPEPADSLPEGIAPSPPATPEFKASTYFPASFWEPSAQIPAIDEATYKERLERVKGQQRAVSIAQENLNLQRQLLKAEGLYVDTQIEGVNTQIKRQELSTIGVKLEQAQVNTQIEQAGLATTRINLQQAQTKTQIESAKLTELQHDANGYQLQSDLKKQTWDLKLEGLRHDLDVASKLLSEKRTAMSRQFSAMPTR